MLKWNKIGEGSSNAIQRVYYPKDIYNHPIIIGYEVGLLREDGTCSDEHICVVDPTTGASTHLPIENYSHWLPITAPKQEEEK